MYMELTPQDTIKDLQRLLIDSLQGFEYPRKNLYDFNVEIKRISEDELVPGDFIIGNYWNEIINYEGEPSENEPPPSQELGFYDPSLENRPPQPIKNELLVERSSFGEELTPEEIEILAILMMNGWLQRQITSIENTRMKYSGTDFKMTSQANHLSKLQSLLTECQRQSHHMQRLYKRRELTGNGTYQSTWYWFGEHGTTNIR